MRAWKTFAAALLAIAALASSAFGHHFKGLPHYSYYEHYPQVPQEEFLGQEGQYEYSLVLYDFQGLNQADMEQPDNARLYLIIFNLRANDVYEGPLTLAICDRDAVVYEEVFAGPEEECVYALQQDLPSTGKYSLLVTLGDGSDQEVRIPFRLSSQKTYWGRKVAGALALLILVVAVGSRRARVMQDRRASARRRNRA
ncbi:MAG: hypothetical protein HKN20_00060 [Gemmatimonadetes bacterium]|nr:hypothetical protein [Gemmatimonadota bacterium]